MDAHLLLHHCEGKCWALAVLESVFGSFVI